MDPVLDIDVLRTLAGTDRDPLGLSFAPLAEALRCLGQLSEAQDLVQEGTARLPEFASGHLVAARILADLGDLGAARRHFDRVLELDPANARGLEGAARAAWSQGDIVAARTLALRWRTLEPRRALDADGLLDRIHAAEAEVPPAAPPARGLGTMGAATPTPTPHDALDPEDHLELSEEEGGVVSGREELITRTMAELLVAQGLHNDAVDLFERLLERAPDSPDLVARLAELKGEVVPEEDVGIAASNPIPVDHLSPETQPVGELAPSTVPIEALVLEPSPVADLAPDTTSIRELAPDRQAGEVDEEFRRWLEGLST